MDKSTKNTKYIYETIIYMPNKEKKSKKNPTNPINKHVNKYNSKNKYFYNPDNNYYLKNYTYITNSGVYI